MEQGALMNALIQVKRIGNLLNEVQDVTQQLAEATDRNDQVSVEMLVAMRRDPINKLMAANEALRSQLEQISDPVERDRLAKLLDGCPAQLAEEEQLAGQVAANGRRLDRVLEMDKALNRKLAREKTVYQ